MATSKYIRGLSGSGFRVPTNGSATALQRCTENANVQVDLDHDKTQKILFGEKDNFVRVAASNSTTTTIIGLTRYGFRIKNSSGAWVTVKLGSGVHTLTLAVGEVRRILRRNSGRYMFAASATNVNIRGINDRQVGFDINDTKSGGASEDKITNANPTNVNDEDEVVVGTKTYAFETALTEVFATDTVTTSGTPASTRAVNTVTTSGTGAANNDTLVVNGRTYTFKTTLTGAADEVVRDGTEDHDLTNLIAAINGTAGEGSTYGTGTVVNADVSAGTLGTHNVVLTAKSYKAAIGNALTLSKTGAVLSVTGATFATGANETVTVNGHVYTFVEALDAATADEVLINGQDVSLDNLRAAINGSAGAGTTYGTGTVANADATCAARAGHVVTLSAKSKVAATGNALTLAVVGSHLARGSATFTGGVDPVANEVKVGGSADASLTNLSEAINAGANVGVDYSTGTTANADATASAVVSHAITLSAVAGGSASITVTESTSGARLTVQKATLQDPLSSVYSGKTVSVNPQDPAVYTQLRRHFKSWVEA